MCILIRPNGSSCVGHVCPDLCVRSRANRTASAQDWLSDLAGQHPQRLEMWDWFEAETDNPFAFSGNLIRLGLSQTGKRFD
jgi:hypothetical protein